MNVLVDDIAVNEHETHPLHPGQVHFTFQTSVLAEQNDLHNVGSVKSADVVDTTSVVKEMVVVKVNEQYVHPAQTIQVHFADHWFTLLGQKE